MPEITKRGREAIKTNQNDIIVGIPSLNEADSIRYVVEQADKGLTKYFPNHKCKIVNVDNNSQDNTKEVFLNTKTKNEKIYISTPPGIIGKGNNFYNLFSYVRKVGAKGTIIVDADLKSITPEWIKKLGEPILKGEDFVFPQYIRHRYDGTITNNIVFPLIYSLFNRFIRQPIAGEIAISSRLINYYLQQEWTETTKQFGIDTFIATNAIIGGFSIDQVQLGQKIHKPSAPKLDRMFLEVVDTMFDIIISNKEKIKELCQNEKPETSISPFTQEPEEVILNEDQIKDTSMQDYQQKKDIIKKILTKNTFEKVDYSFNNGLIVSSDLWSEIVFEFIKSYEKETNKLEVVEAIKPLYWATLHSFIKKTRDFSIDQAEDEIIKRAEIFHEKKSRFFEN